MFVSDLIKLLERENKDADVHIQVGSNWHDDISTKRHTHVLSDGSSYEVVTICDHNNPYEANPAEYYSN